MNKQILLICIAVLFAAAGCSQKSTLTGKVTYTDDGSPVTQGSVIFLKGISQARGVIMEDGTYELSTTGNLDGIEPGEYKVYLTGIEKVTQVKQRNGSFLSKYEPLVAEKYTSPDTSELIFTVDDKTHQFDIQVERYKRPGRR